jgi:DNA-binding transcriptional MerR regulator
MPSEYTLTELSKISGEPVRRIRSYIQEGLLPRPLSAGRNATYPERSLQRLLAIKNLRANQRLSLDEARTVLAHLGENEISDLAAGSSTSLPSSEMTRYRSQFSKPGRRSRTQDALRYIQGLNRGDSDNNEQIVERSRASRTPDDEQVALSFRETAEHLQSGQRMSSRSRSQASKSESPMRKLVERLNQLTPSEGVTRRARSEEWVKVSITPDIELHVRKEFGEYDMAAFELLADYIREALSGGI